MNNGLVAPEAYANPTTPYYLEDEGGEIVPSPIIISPLQLRSADESRTAPISCRGLTAGVAGPYTGGVNISTAASSAGPAADGLTLRSIAGGVSCEVGTNAQANNQLLVAGASGLSRVNDPVYNPAVSLKALTLSATNPLCVPTPGNVGELFRCAQAGVAASAAAAVGTNFQVPSSGWYSLQIEVQLGNAPAPAAPNINVPIVAAGGIDVGETLTFVIAEGVVVTPYGAHECVSQEFAVSDILVQGGNVVRQYVSQHLLAAGTTYSFTLKSSSALWDIGTNGQIKAELIAMC